jgi:hypothetical protein
MVRLVLRNNNRYNGSFHLRNKNRYNGSFHLRNKNRYNGSFNLRSKNRYNSAFDFVQQKPLHHRFIMIILYGYRFSVLFP